MVEDHLSVAAQLFLKYNYEETKDLAKSFLTLAASLLVLSVTFSEKIVNFQEASKSVRGAIILSWTAMVFAIIVCGIAICLNSLAGGEAVYGHGSGFVDMAQRSYALIGLSGGLFVVGLIALVVAGILSMAAKPDKIPKLEDSTEV